MGNDFDYKGKHLVLQPVPRSEFEALKRFGDYEELHDGTLMRGRGRHGISEGVLNLFGANLIEQRR
jgi:hypothetical protein